MDAKKHIGHGIGLRRRHYEAILDDTWSGVDWFETIAENHFVPGGRPWAVLERVRRDVPVVVHGVALGVGGLDQVSEAHLEALATVVERIQPAWVSDHLAWGSLGGHYTHELLPLAYTEGALKRVAANVMRVQDRLRQPILLENISAYLSFGASTIPEAEFLNELTQRTGCGVLLDLNNLVVCERNLGQSAQQFLATLRPGSVGQLHLAGHTDCEDLVIDTHVGPVPDRVWQLYRAFLRRFGPVPTLVEWDEDVPAFAIVAEEARRARELEAEVLRVAA